MLVVSVIKNMKWKDWRLHCSQWLNVPLAVRVLQLSDKTSASETATCNVVYDVLFYAILLILRKERSLFELEYRISQRCLCEMFTCEIFNTLSAWCAVVAAWRNDTAKWPSFQLYYLWYLVLLYYNFFMCFYVFLCFYCFLSLSSLLFSSLCLKLLEWRHRENLIVMSSLLL